MHLVPPKDLALQENEVEQELTSILFKPDIEAFRILTAAIAAHQLRPHGYPPVWVMLIGPSGSGKTTMLELLPASLRLSDLTPQTFLSGYKRNGKRNSLLHQLGPDAVVLMKDFTTILSMRFEKKSEIMSQLREIHDGYTSKHTGMGDLLAWSGRLTFITCCTPAIDQDRMTFRIMGDRFLEVRWNSPIGIARHVIESRNKPTTTELRKKVKQHIDNVGPYPQLSTAQVETLEALSECTAYLRTPVIHDEKGYKIIGVGVPEAPSRIAQCLTSLVLSNSALNHHDCINDADMALAYRVSLDSIPPGRLKVLQAIDSNGTPREEITLDSRWTRDRTIDDLLALDLLDQSMSQSGDTYLFHSTKVSALLTPVLSR